MSKTEQELKTMYGFIVRDQTYGPLFEEFVTECFKSEGYHIIPGSRLYNIKGDCGVDMLISKQKISESAPFTSEAPIYCVRLCSGTRLEASEIYRSMDILGLDYCILLSIPRPAFIRSHFDSHFEFLSFCERFK